MYGVIRKSCPRPFSFCRTSCNWAARSSSLPLPCGMLASFVANVECSEVNSQILFSFRRKNTTFRPATTASSNFPLQKNERFGHARMDRRKKEREQFEARLHSAMTGPVPMRMLRTYSHRFHINFSTYIKCFLYIQTNVELGRIDYNSSLHRSSLLRISIFGFSICSN